MCLSSVSLPLARWLRKCLAYFLFRLFMQLLLNFMILCKFWEQSFIRYVFCKYFPLSLWLSSHSLDTLFHKAQVFNLNELQAYQFFLSWIMVLYPKGHCHTQGHPRFSPICQELYSFAFYVYVQDIFQINLYEVYEVCVQILSFAFGCPIISMPFVEKTIFASWYCLSFSDKDQLTILIWSVSELSILFH